jgi:hypothetical protein
MDAFARTLALLRPQSLYPAWRCVELMERKGEMSAEEATRWKQGIYGLMALWAVDPDSLKPPTPSR